MVLLALESENGAVLTYRLSKSQITVGSSSKNDVVVRSPGVAERHLVMHRTAGAFTFVTVDRLTVVQNGERRSRGVLNPGDKIRIGAMTLVFRSGDAVGVTVEKEMDARGDASAPVPREASEQTVFLPDPAGFAAARSKLVEILATPRRDCCQGVVALIRESLPGVEVAVLVPGGNDGPTALASVWSGELPRLAPAVLEELLTPGRYAQVSNGEGPVVVVPIVTPTREMAAIVAARPVGRLGNEGVGLLGEAARLLGMRWSEVDREAGALGGAENEVLRRLEDHVPGSSQAIQVLRAGMLAAALGNDPVLICGAEGVGRTEMARLLVTLGSAPGGAAAIVDCQGQDEGRLRIQLFGHAGHPSLTPAVEGALAQARGGALILRGVDRLPVPLQAELAGLIAAQQREAVRPGGGRWIATCGEDPLALVQQGKLGSALFLAFSRRMLRVPRLAERREDLPLLIAGLLRRVAAEQEKSVRGITLDCLNALLAQSFPGEFTELVAEINRLVTATPDGEMVRCEGLQVGGAQSAAAGAEAVSSLSDVLASDDLKQIVPRVERLVIDRVMRRLKGNQSKAARTLGISRGALIAKLKEYEVQDYRFLRRKKAVS
ncbi:MAG: sigma 54-interacting transcriptional regulator [Acidobacteriia bacterium]|nr:sigma 54-interacting transcriptional regulator [Terriglobia bacterium]